MIRLLGMNGKDYRAGLDGDLREVLDHAQSAAEDARDMKSDKGYRLPREEREKIREQVIRTEKFLKVVKRNTGIR